MKLGIFGYHTDPAIDFCIEVDALEGLHYDVSVGAGDREELQRRVERAMHFRVGGDTSCIDAKAVVRRIDSALSSPSVAEKVGVK